MTTRAPVACRCAGLAAVAGTVLTSVAFGQHQWLDRSQIAAAQSSFNLNGSGVLIGQLELGTTRYDHVTLDGAAPGSVVQNNRLGPAPTENDGHATLVASIMAGRPNAALPGFRGAAPAAKLAVNAWSNRSGALSGWEDDLYESGKWMATAPRADLINMSASFRTQGPTPGSPTQNSRSALAADWTVANRGILWVNSAGNQGTLGDGTLGSPSSGYNVLTVGATGETGALRNYERIADYSSRGVRNGRPKPDMVAPGSRVGGASNADGNGNGTFDDGREDSGTSFSTPQVSGTAALMVQQSRNWGLGASATDARTMKAVLMNSAEKRVRNSVGVRWQDDATLGQGANPISNETGVGQLDAYAAVAQLRAGQQRATHVDATLNVNPRVSEKGWDLGSVGNPQGPLDGFEHSNDYVASRPNRKGTYVTATLAWNREVTIVENPDGTPDWGNINTGYGTNKNLELAISEAFSDFRFRNIVQVSQSPDGSTEHAVYKTIRTSPHYVQAWQRTPGPATTYAVAWDQTFAVPWMQMFNGNFSAVENRYNDNGWFNTSGNNARVLPADFLPYSEAADDIFAMRLDGSVTTASMAQETVNPFGWFQIQFSYGFMAAGSSLQILLNGVNIFEFDSLPGDSLTPDVSSLNQYAPYTLQIADPEFFNRIGGAGRTADLSFVANGGLAFIDDIYYVPGPGGIVLVGLAGIAACRRRR